MLGNQRDNLQGNEIGYAGAQAIAKALEANAKLEATAILLAGLNLLGYKIGNAGAQAIAKALETDPTLKSIGHSGNNIKEAAGAALETNTTIIELYGNNIGDAEAEDIAKMLKKNFTLTSIIIDSNQISGAGLEAIAAALESGRTPLIKLEFRFKPHHRNTIEETRALEKIAAIINQNKMKVSKLAHTLVDLFSNNPSSLDNLSFKDILLKLKKDINAFKLFQAADKNLLKYEITSIHGKDDGFAQGIITKVEDFIKEYYLNLIGVCKSDPAFSAIQGPRDGINPNKTQSSNDKALTLPKQIMDLIISKLDYSDHCLFIGDKKSQAANRKEDNSKQNAENQFMHDGDIMMAPLDLTGELIDAANSPMHMMHS